MIDLMKQLEQVVIANEASSHERIVNSTIQKEPVTPPSPLRRHIS